MFGWGKIAKIPAANEQKRNNVVYNNDGRAWLPRNAVSRICPLFPTIFRILHSLPRLLRFSPAATIHSRPLYACLIRIFFLFRPATPERLIYYSFGASNSFQLNAQHKRKRFFLRSVKLMYTHPHFNII